MSQFHFEPARESDAYALPDAETFYVSPAEARANAAELAVSDEREGGIMDEPGWYYWACFPGCLPDSDPIGPFDTEADAIADAQESAA